MRRLVAVLCVHALLSCRPAPTTGTSDASTADSPARAIDEATVKAMSHALLDADGRGDSDAFARATASSFVLFEREGLRTREDCLKGLRAAGADPGPPRVLTYGKEYVSVGDASAVFIGEAVEHSPSDGGRTVESDGWSTIVWAREDGVWKATLWQWTHGGLDAARDDWNDTFRRGIGFSSDPNKFLADMVKGRKPGSALDVGMGQGRNALYLASQGWNVTGIDISEEGLRLVQDAALRRKLAVETVNADATTWDYGAEKWDLVTLIYAGFSDEKLVARLRPSVKHGGLVVVDGFHKDAPSSLGFETGQLAALFKDGFTVLRDDVVEDVGDWGGERRKLSHFAAEKR
jgi:hypothetical protein